MPVPTFSISWVIDMRNIVFKWREEQGQHVLAVEFERMWPFQIEEIEDAAAELGFVVNRDQPRMGEKFRQWTPPESSEAIVAMRNRLHDLGYTTEFLGEDDQ